ncbi:MAG: DUF1499 domain-containing protein [Sulfitobacter sp.]
MSTGFLIGVALGVAALGYIRLAPQDLSRWHQPIEGSQDRTGTGEALRVVQGGAPEFAALHDAMMQIPRTKVLAGDLAAGRITYITRSLVMSFPDYTTIEQSGTQIKLLGRLRFGKSDLGVNGKRLDGLLRAAGLR